MRKIGALFAALCFLVILIPVLAFAQDTGVVSNKSFLYDLWTIVQPVVALAVTLVGTPLIGWIALRISTLTGQNNEIARLKIEGEIRNALHAAALNGLKYAMTRAGIPGGGAPTATVIAEAIDYIRTKSPDTAKQAGASDIDLEQIILSKFPDVIGMIKNAKASSPPAARSGG